RQPHGGWPAGTSLRLGSAGAHRRGAGSPGLGGRGNGLHRANVRPAARATGDVWHLLPDGLGRDDGGAGARRRAAERPMSVSVATAPSPLDKASPRGRGSFPRGRWLALGFIALAQFMVALDATIVNLELPTAQSSL